MDRSVGCHIEADVLAATHLVLSVAPSAVETLGHEELVVSLDGEQLPVHEVEDAHRTRLHVVDHVPVGRLTVDYDASTSGRSGPAPVTEIDRLRYLRPSRYCESDVLSAFAHAEFRELDGRDLLDGISSWVGQRVAYVAGSSRPIDGAVSTLLSREGVCRDFAHLVVSALRACGVPARMVSVYAPGLDPMDFHAVAEALIDDEWLAADATTLAPRESMVRIATGRDAADTAFLTTADNSLTLTALEVTAVTEGPLPFDDVTEAVRLG